ncbi:hypothetical protein Tco_0369577 [Tanacetum coccineum]
MILILKTDIMDPVMQCTTLPSHSESLKIFMFHFSRRSTRFYRLSHSEIVDIEKDLIAAAKNHFMELNELTELRDGAYENTRIYKERSKRWHDVGDMNFKVGDKVFLFNSRFKMHPGKLKLRWYGQNVVMTVYLYGTIEIIDRNEISFKVNGKRLKKYHDGHIDVEDKEVVEFKEDTT